MARYLRRFVARVQTLARPSRWFAVDFAITSDEVQEDLVYGQR